MTAQTHFYSPQSARPRRLALAAAIGAALLVPLAGGAAAAELQGPPAVAAGTQFADIIERTQPAVVKIEVRKKNTGIERLQGNVQPFGPDGPLSDFFRRFGPGPRPFGAPGGPPQTVAGVGSGFIIDSAGYIVTNDHVVADAEDLQVTLEDGTIYPGKLVGHDELTDLALIKIDAETALPAVEFGDSDRSRVGEWVVAIGSPFGLSSSVSAGIISARGRDIKSGPYDDYLQIDAPINSGNSGGPIIDGSGKVIGVSTAIFSPTGGNIGIGFAIPARDAAQVVAQLRADGRVTRGWLGIQIQPLTADLAESFGLADADGALVAEVLADGPAERAGLREGDIVVRIDGTEIDEPRDLSRAVAHARPGTRVRLDIVRRDQAQTLTVALGTNDNQVVADAGPAPGASDSAPTLGLALQRLTSSLRSRLGVSDDVEGTVIARVAPGSPAAAAGLKAGDVLIRVNDQAAADVAATASALRDATRDGSAAALLVRRGEGQIFTAVKIG